MGVHALIFMAALAFPAPEDSAPGAVAEPSPRGERSFAVAVGGAWHSLSDQSLPVPMLQLEWAPLPYLAVELRAASGIVIGDYTAGVKGYLLDNALSPYGVVRVGVYHYTTEGQSPFFAFHTVAGLSWMASFGLEFSVELGAIFQPLKEDFYVKRAAPEASALIGYRF